MACQGARGRSRHTTPIVSTELRPPLHSGQPPRAETALILPLPLRLILILLLSRLSPSLSPPRSRSPPSPPPPPPPLSLSLSLFPTPPPRRRHPPPPPPRAPCFFSCNHLPAAPRWRGCARAARPLSGRALLRISDSAIRPSEAENVKIKGGVGSKRGPRGDFSGPRGATQINALLFFDRWPPRGPKRGPRGAPEGPKTAPRAPKRAPRAPQEGPKRRFFGPRRGYAN